MIRVDDVRLEKKGGKDKEDTIKYFQVWKF